MGGERLEIILAVEPVPKARPRFGQGRAYTPERTASFETTVRWLMRQATLKQKLIIPALAGNIAVDMTFWTRSETSDWDNYAKAICDAGNKILWKDDRQIKEAHVRVLKITASMLPHIELAAWELD
jgi:Holliday junction resolvase RusA-like endonuclease